MAKSVVDNGVKFIGKYKICTQFESEVFEDYFAIEIFVPYSFPDDIPTVKTTDGKIRANNYKGHVYTNGQFCLEIDTAIAAFLMDNPSLLAFLKRFLDTYLFGFLFYQKYKRLPFGEHTHGIVGLMDFYCELFNTTDIKIAYSLLTCLFKENMKGHNQCPCQSGKRYRNCHREKVNELRASRLYRSYEKDFATIVAELNKTNER